MKVPSGMGKSRIIIAAIALKKLFHATNFFTVVFCFTCWEQHLLISIALRTLACFMHVFIGSYGMLLLA